MESGHQIQVSRVPGQPVVIFETSVARRAPPTEAELQRLLRYERHLPIQHDCVCCGKSLFDMRSCTRCWWAKYCNKSCQQADWVVHQRMCRQDATRSQCLKGGRILEVELVPGTETVDRTHANEDALFLHLDTCPKHGHNNHAAFLDVNEFTKRHLPAIISYDEIANYILAQSHTTVRVLVKWTSTKRPEGDACARFRGTRQARMASGTYVLNNYNNFLKRRCPVGNCHRARDLGDSHEIFEGDLKIFTNKHVLFDEEELRHTVVDFFYDSGSRAGVLREYGTKLFYTKPSSDKTFLKVTVHDEHLLLRLKQLDLDRSLAFKKLTRPMLRAMSAFAIVISHPHGLPKRISIGRVVRITEENLSGDTRANAKVAGELEKRWFETKSEEDYAEFMDALGKLNLPVYKVWYDTATCQGSSGAPVLFGARQVAGEWGPYIANHTAHDIDEKLNYFKVVMLGNKAFTNQL